MKATLGTLLRAGALLSLLAWLASAPATAQTDSPEQPPETPSAATPAAPATLPDTEDPAGAVFEELEVRSRADSLLGKVNSATAGTVGAVDLASRPILRPGELLEAVPGLVLTQHSGDGKANQFFLRGFNLDHGTDFRTTIAGMPVNLPSHGHGQGYSDVNFLIPELVAEVDYRKGPYAARDADFAAAGAIEVDYVSSLEDALAEVTYGENGYARLVGAQSFTLADGSIFLGAIDLATNDGPWERPENLRKGSALLRWSGGDAASSFRLTAIGYSADWDSTDQIPRRAVDQGQISRFGNLDDTLGGETSRLALAGDWVLARNQGSLRLAAYVYHYDLDLFSNFTYFLDDPVNGDQFEQTDRRLVGGLSLERERVMTLFTRDARLTWGLGLRGDDIDNGLFHTAARERLSITRADSIRQYSGGPWAEAHLAWNDWFRTTLGYRVDLYAVDVESNVAANSDSVERVIGSPKLGLAFGPWAHTELYLNLGYGFHSNDARGATIRVDPSSGEPAERVDPMVRGRAADLGLRGEWLPGLATTVSLFYLELDSELLFVGDAGTTEASRPSRRQGIEFANFWRLSPRVSMEFDAAFSRARFSDSAPEGDFIPGAIEQVVSAAVNFRDFHRFFGGLRLRYFGERPLVEDDSIRSQSSTLLNGRLGLALGGGWELAVEAFNLLDEEVSDVDYFYASRLAGEPASGVEDFHFHPSEPRSFRIQVAKRF
jgi:hypothetical protein